RKFFTFSKDDRFYVFLTGLFASQPPVQLKLGITPWGDKPVAFPVGVGRFEPPVRRNERCNFTLCATPLELTRPNSHSGITLRCRRDLLDVAWKSVSVMSPMATCIGRSGCNRQHKTG